MAAASKFRAGTFPIYLFVFLCSLLFPDDLRDYRGFEDYFMSRRKWFFGLLAATFLLDSIDTELKGGSYFLVIWIAQRYFFLS